MSLIEHLPCITPQLDGTSAMSEGKDVPFCWVEALEGVTPVQVNEYAGVSGINQRSTFSFWVSHVLKKCRKIIFPFGKRILGIGNQHFVLNSEVPETH